MRPIRLAPYAAIAASAAVLCYPLITGNLGYLFYPSDGPLHLLWAQQFVKSMHSFGLLYPRWASDLNAGAGSASFVFYPPFTFYTYALASVFTKNIPTAMTWSMATGMLLSGLSMYAFCRAFFGRWPSVLPSVLYMAMPYHLATLYYRGFLAEFWAFVWVPLIGLFLHAFSSRKDTLPLPNFLNNPGGYFAGLAASYSGLVLTHLPTALLVSFFMAAHAIAFLVSERNLKRFFLRLNAMAMGLCLSAVYLLPVLLERGMVNIAALTDKAYFDIRNNFIFSSRALDTATNMLASRIAVFAFLLAATGLAAIFLMRKLLVHSAGASAPEGTTTAWRTSSLFIAIVGAVSIFFMLEVSTPLWLAMPFVRQVQYPYRLLVITTFCASFSAGLAVHAFSQANRSTVIKAVLVIFLLVAMFFNSVETVGIFRLYKGFFTPERLAAAQPSSIRADMEYLEMEQNMRLFHPKNKWLSDVPEYRPIWSVEGVTGGASTIPLPGRQDQAGVFASGGGKIEVVKWTPEERQLRVEASSASSILLRTFYYPGWRVEVAGEVEVARPHNQTGLIIFDLPPGQHNVRVFFDKGSAYKIGLATSAVGTIMLIAGWFFLRKEEL